MHGLENPEMRAERLGNDGYGSAYKKSIGIGDMIETWQTVPGYHNYQASSLGNIRRKNSKKNLKPQPFKCGYLGVWLYDSRQRKLCSVHRIVLLSFLGRPISGMECNHKNSIRTDNRLSNLEYVTRSQNSVHAFRCGFRIPKRGSANPAAKLKEDDIPVIFDLRKNGFSQTEIAQVFDVSRSMIGKILSGDYWKTQSLALLHLAQGFPNISTSAMPPNQTPAAPNKSGVA